MNSLYEIVSIMNSEDKKEFIRYLNKRNKRLDIKNISYFKNLENDDIIKEKYFNKQAYHALRKRLYDNLIEFLSNRTFEKNTDEIHASLRFLVLSNFFLEHNLEKDALKYLKKAEERAIHLEQFSLLNEIYQTQINYLHLFPNQDLNYLTDKINFNLNQIQKEIQLNIGYAFIRKELQKIHQEKKVINFKNLINDILIKLDLNFNEIITYKSLYQILFIGNEFGNIHQNFSLIEPFVKSGYEFLESKKDNSENHLFYHIQIVYFLANFHFRTNQFAECQQYLDEMKTLMQKKNKAYLKTFYLKYNLLFSLNIHYSGNSKMAMDKVESVLKNSAKKDKIEDLYDLKLTLATFYAQHNDRKVLKLISQMNHTDFWFEKKMGMLWTIRKNLLEILIQVQFENTELAVSRLQSFKRRYKKYLWEVNETRVMDFVSMVESMVKKPEIIKDLKFKEEIYKVFKTDENLDPFILSFWGWIICQIENKTPYEATLELIKK
ncbi:hypothetical protein [Moheibacter sediminis]|uniref:Uncharacterized protein n=1 Tax=Moheibacter sediminis TaxID=1434700 RepID=A0A1W1Y784_9FLAO|nr:hypothetical protein [Moheibacter sediminis]SMC32022.1 hypothetical protein SAMN06296427_10143 [Moheibacter sediminis]